MTRVGETMLRQGEEVDEIFFINSGSAILTKEFHSPIYGKTELDVAVLPEGSFFGELPGLLGISPAFGLRSGEKREKKGEKLIRNGIEYNMFFAYDHTDLRDLCKDYPEFGTHVYIRGEVRTAFFKHQAQLRIGEYTYKMKIIELEAEIDRDRIFRVDSVDKRAESSINVDHEEDALNDGKDVAYQSAKKKAK